MKSLRRALAKEAIWAFWVVICLTSLVFWSILPMELSRLFWIVKAFSIFWACLHFRIYLCLDQEQFESLWSFIYFGMDCIFEFLLWVFGVFSIFVLFCLVSEVFVLS